MPRRAVELGGELHRHGRLLRTLGRRGADPGGALSVPGGVVIATKAGLTRFSPVTGSRPSSWPLVARPEYLRQEAVMRMRRMRLDPNRSLAVASHRPEGAVAGPDRRAQKAPGRGQGQAHRSLRGGGRPAERRAGDRGDRVDPEPMQPGRSVRTARVGLLHRPRHRVHSYRPLASGSLAGEGSPLGELADGHGCRRQAARRGGCSKRSSTNRRRSRGPQTSRVQVARRDRLGSVAASARSFTVQSWRR